MDFRHVFPRPEVGADDVTRQAASADKRERAKNQRNSGGDENDARIVVGVFKSANHRQRNDPNTGEPGPNDVVARALHSGLGSILDTSI